MNHEVLVEDGEPRERLKTSTVSTGKSVGEYTAEEWK
jgi:hypothetical protein